MKLSNKYFLQIIMGHGEPELFGEVTLDQAIACQMRAFANTSGSVTQMTIKLSKKDYAEQSYEDKLEAEVMRSAINPDETPEDEMFDAEHGITMRRHNDLIELDSSFWAYQRACNPIERARMTPEDIESAKIAWANDWPDMIAAGIGPVWKA